MTPELPDDPRDWPSDPFALLGVERSANETDIKRAYTRLIRKYKPERSPEEFRLIREAYEACTTRRPWFFDNFIRSSAEEPPAEKTELQPEPEPETSPFPKPIDEVKRLWSLAASGQLADAYAPLARLAEQDPSRTDLPLRLYWLLSLDPQLDSARSRLHWLADSLARSRLQGPALELYRRELTVDPEAALYGPFISLLKVEAGASEKLAVARLRLTAAGRSQSWNVIATDLQELAKSVPMASEPMWLSHLVSVFDWAAWDRPEPLFGIVKDETRKLRHLELTQGWHFDRLEEAENVSGGFSDRASNLISWRWARLVPTAWAAGGSLEPEDLEPALREITEDASEAATRFDRFRSEFGPAVPMTLIRALEEYRERTGPPAEEFPADWIRALAARMPGGWKRDYGRTREDLLEFLVVNGIHPDEFAAACETDPDPRIRDVMPSLQGDLTLKLIWLSRTLAG